VQKRIRDLLRRTRSFGQIEHVLAVNSFRCRQMQTALAHGLEIDDWRDQSALSVLARTVRVVPDGFFILRKSVGGRSISAAFFLEVERSPRDPRVMLEKYSRLKRFHARGEYGRLFGRSSFRLLVATSGFSPESESAWALRLADLALRAGLSAGYFASRRKLLAVDPPLPMAVERKPMRVSKRGSGNL